MPPEIVDRTMAPDVWKDILKKYPVVSLTGATYRSIHGQPSRNQPISPSRALYRPSEEVLTAFRTRDCLDPDPLFALGSVVYLLFKDKEGRRKVEDMAFLTIDFDCTKSNENLTTITNTLGNVAKTVPWTVLDSGNSYHAIIDALLPPENIPWHYGKIIQAFSDAADSSPFIKDLGIDLQRYWNNTEKLKDIEEKIINGIKHYSDPVEDARECFIVDLRWIAHSLSEYRQYRARRRSSFGFLRISPNIDGVSPPVMIAKGNH